MQRSRGLIRIIVGYRYEFYSTSFVSSSITFSWFNLIKFAIRCHGKYPIRLRSRPRSNWISRELQLIYPRSWRKSMKRKSSSTHDLPRRHEVPGKNQFRDTVYTKKVEMNCSIELLPNRNDFSNYLSTCWLKQILFRLKNHDEIIFPSRISQSAQ